MDEALEVPKPEPKISDVEIILVGLFFVTLDLIDLIPIAGDITDIVAAPMGFYYWAKGINGTAFIVAEVLDAIPGLQEIPSRTIGWGISVWMDRHPKALGKLEMAIEVADALEGNVEEAEEVAKENVAKEAVQLPSDRLEMKQNADGAWEHNPEADARESTNAKPSEKTTESDAQTGVKEAGRPSEEQTPLEQEEDRRYEELTEPEAAKNPVDEAKKRYFAAPEPPQPGKSAIVGGERFTQKQQEIQQEKEAKRKKEEEERIELEKPKQPEMITEDEDQARAA